MIQGSVAGSISRASALFQWHGRASDERSEVARTIVSSVIEILFSASSPLVKVLGPSPVGTSVLSGPK